MTSSDGIGGNRFSRKVSVAAAAAQREAVVPGMRTSSSTSARPRASAVAVATAVPSITNVNVAPGDTLRMENSTSCDGRSVLAELHFRLAGRIGIDACRREHGFALDVVVVLICQLELPAEQHLSLCIPHFCDGALVKSPVGAVVWPLSCTTMYTAANQRREQTADRNHLTLVLHESPKWSTKDKVATGHERQINAGVGLAAARQDRCERRAFGRGADQRDISSMRPSDPASQRQTRVPPRRLTRCGQRRLERIARRCAAESLAECRRPASVTEST